MFEVNMEVVCDQNLFRENSGRLGYGQSWGFGFKDCIDFVGVVY